VELSTKAHDLLDLARSQDSDTSECEEIIKKAENLTVIAQNCLEGGDYDTVEICVESAVEAYEEAIKKLKSLC
jgi:hypothetical protein